MKGESKQEIACTRFFFSLRAGIRDTMDGAALDSSISTRAGMVTLVELHTLDCIPRSATQISS